MKETYYVHFQAHNLNVGTTRIGLHALMLKKHISFLILSSAAAV